MRRLVRWLLRGVVAWACTVALVSLLLHPYWAVTRTSGSRVLVVEGWMHDAGMREAAGLFARQGYERVVVTGSVRPFAYYLRQGDTLTLRFAEARMGDAELRYAGLPGERLQLLADSTLLLDARIGEGSERKTVQLPATMALRLTVPFDGATPSPHAAVHIAGLRINGRNAHDAITQVELTHADGTRERGAPTFAHYGEQLLVGQGIARERIVVLPTWRVERGKTYSAGRDVAAWARGQRVAAYDVATLAVHARRTWRMHRIARGNDAVGIVALHDPWCQRWSWWGNYYGWYQVLKETLALPLPWLVDRASDDEDATSPAPR